jgi:serine-type D-Ala-D-Ala carboxypeptidase/endopeptidase
LGNALDHPEAPPSLESIERLASVAPLFAEHVQQVPVPGLAWGIVWMGQLVLLDGIGVQDTETGTPVGADTVFRIASMTKAVTALTVLKLRDDGWLRLDALAEEYVPQMRGWRYPTPDSPRIRVRDLLHHTAGLVTDDPWADRQNAMSEADFTDLLARGVPFSRPPGTAMEYSNLGYAILGRVVSSVCGRPYAAVVADTLLHPLGMASSGFEPAVLPAAACATGYRWAGGGAWQAEPVMPHGAFSPMGGLLTTARDYACWLAFLLDAWPARDAPDLGPVKRATVREMVQGSNFLTLAPAWPGADGDGSHRTSAYAMGLRTAVDSELGLVLSHAGGYPGYGAYMMALPEQGVGIFAFTNRTYAVPSRPVAEAARALWRSGCLAPRDTAVSVELAEAYGALIRVYEQGDITAAGDGLAMNVLLDRDAP